MEQTFDGGFVDAREMAKMYPESFDDISKEKLEFIRKGVNVKINNGLERFWVEVKSVNGKEISGTVNNELIFPIEYDYGDKITFNINHVYDMI